MSCCTIFTIISRRAAFISPLLCLSAMSRAAKVEMWILYTTTWIYGRWSLSLSLARFIAMSLADCILCRESFHRRRVCSGIPPHLHTWVRERTNGYQEFRNSSTTIRLTGKLHSISRMSLGADIDTYDVEISEISTLVDIFFFLIDLVNLSHFPSLCCVNVELIDNLKRSRFLRLHDD